MSDDGDLAFPISTGMTSYKRGLSKRDYFAAKAMQSWIDKFGSLDGNPEFAAEVAYRYADAMLKERVK